jgi:hypothetical protein
MQLEDQTFLSVMDKLIALKSGKGAKGNTSGTLKKLKAIVEFRTSQGDPDTYIYAWGDEANMNGGITLADLKQIVQENE